MGLEDHPLNIYAAQEFDHRRNFSGEKKASWDLKKLHETAHEILNLKSLGFTHVQIASLLGVTKENVHCITNSSLGREKLTIMRGVRDGEAFDIVKEVQERARKCMEVIDEVLYDSEEVDEDGKIIPAQVGLKDKVKVAMDTLKMGGFEAPKKLDARFAHMHMLDANALEAIKLRSRDVAREFGLVVQSLNNEGGVACGGGDTPQSLASDIVGGGNGDGKARSGEAGKPDQHE